jgi:MFS family permease
MVLLYGPNDAEARLAREIHIIRIENESASQSPKMSWMSCFRGSDFKRTITAALLFSLTNLAGAAFLSQNIYFLITAGLEAVHSFDIGIGGFAFAALLIAFSGVYLQRISRRNAILGGLIFNLVLMTIIGALNFASGRGSLWAIAILMNVLISFQAAILQGVGWAVAAEVPTPTLRAKTISLGLCGQTLSAWLFQFVTPYMYNVDSGRLGSRVGFVHAGITILLLVGAWFLVPDSTNMTTQEIDEAYHSGVRPRSFRSHVNRVNGQDGNSVHKVV